jgi:hypothetical protein
MAKLKSPLLSFSAHGTLGDVLVYYDRAGKSYVRSKPQDPVSLSLAQGVLRDCFASAAISAHSLTQGQKDYYAALAPNSAFSPWWNNFIGQYIKDCYEAPSVAVTFIKSLQLITHTILDGQQYVDTAINSVNKDMCGLFLLGCNPVNDDSRNFMHYFSISTSTSVRLYRVTSPAIGDLIASAFILEYEPAFITSLQIKSFSFGVNDYEKLITIDEVDLAKTVIFPSGQRSYANVGASVFMLRTDLQDSTTLRMQRLSIGGALDGQVRVVEFI